MQRGQVNSTQAWRVAACVGPFFFFLEEKLGIGKTKQQGGSTHQRCHKIVENVIYSKKLLAKHYHKSCFGQCPNQTNKSNKQLQLHKLDLSWPTVTAAINQGANPISIPKARWLLWRPMKRRQSMMDQVVKKIFRNTKEIDGLAKTKEKLLSCRDWCISWNGKQTHKV